MVTMVERQVWVQGASQGLGGGVGLADEDGEGGGDGVDGDVDSSVGQAGCAGVEGEALVMWLGDGGRRQGTCGFMRGWGRCSVSAQSLPEVLNSCLISWKGSHAIMSS
jgi:hypothetical protein